MKKTKIISVIMSNQCGEYKADYTLKFKKNKNGETEGILTVPYLDWTSPENCNLEYRILTIKDRELECIEKYYFDEYLFTIPIRGYPYTIDMCDILYKVIPPEIYNQMISGTFTMKKDADSEMYARFFQKEKENKSAIRKFISEQKKLGFEMNPKTILYARKIDVPSSSDDNISIILVNKLSGNDKYKVQIYLTNSASEKKHTFLENKFDDIYVAKKFFDYFEYKDKDVLFNKKRFKSLIADFTRDQLKKEAKLINQVIDADCTENVNDTDTVAKVKEILEKQLDVEHGMSPKASTELLDLLNGILFGEVQKK